MAQIYNLRFTAPAALTLKTTRHSHHIGAAALGQTDRSAAGNLRQSHLLQHNPAITSLAGMQGNRINVTCPTTH